MANAGTATETRGSVLAHLRAKQDDGTLEFVASTEALASDGLVVRKEAWTPYLKGGALADAKIPFTANHDAAPEGQAVPAIGRITERHWEDGTGLVVRVKFVGEDVNPQGPRWDKAYRDDVLDAVSISWSGTKRSRKEGEENHVVGLRWHDLSGVLVGADAGAKKRADAGPLADIVAQAEANARGLDASERIDAEPPEESVVEDVGERTIVKDHPGCPSGKPWALVAKHGDPPKILGCHETKEGAAKQEAAIKAQGHAAEAEPQKPLTAEELRVIALTALTAVISGDNSTEAKQRAAEAIIEATSAETRQDAIETACKRIEASCSGIAESCARIEATLKTWEEEEEGEMGAKPKGARSATAGTARAEDGMDDGAALAAAFAGLEEHAAELLSTARGRK